MVDTTYVTKTYETKGGDEIHVASGGKIIVESGGAIQLLTGAKLLPNGGTQTAALTPPVATAATATTPYGYTQTQADAIVTWIRAADAALKAAGITA